MRKQTFCQFCGEPMDFGREFVFLVEAQDFEERVAPLELVQASPHYLGEPLRICKECRASIEENRLDLAEAEARELARSKRNRRSLVIMGVAILIIFLPAVIVELWRWVHRFSLQTG